MRHNFPPAYYEYHGADPPSSSSSYYGQYRVSDKRELLQSNHDFYHEIRIIPSYFFLSFVLSEPFSKNWKIMVANEGAVFVWPIISFFWVSILFIDHFKIMGRKMTVSVMVNCQI